MYVIFLSEDSEPLEFLAAQKLFSPKLLQKQKIVNMWILRYLLSLLQEIAWQVIDELPYANADVISRGSTGLKLYMVAPFLA